MNDNTPPGARNSVRRRWKQRAGLSLVEVLIALAITAMLLTAVAAAYSASAKAIEINDQFFRASQAARVSVNRICSELRQCQGGAVTPPNTLEITTAIGQKHAYSYDSVNKRLLLTVGAAPDSVTYPVASNVQSLTFFSDGDSVGMNIVVAVGNNNVVLNGSAIPRRKVQYE
jgi:prepilin-type N-terminal cleavage/methylation domain-containing protein